MSPQNDYAGFHLEDDEDIEITYHTLSETVMCQICDAVLDKKTPDQRQEHYDKHFSDDSRSTASTSRTSIRPSVYQDVEASKNDRKWKGKQKDLFWYPSQTETPPPNFSPGVVILLKRALLRNHERGSTTRAILCYDRTVHVSRQFWDAGWGCGYRNFEMACTALMDQQAQPFYFPLLDGPFPPSVENLQRCIESAWNEGFDPDGAKDLKHRLVGTHKWIGTAELYVAFTWHKIPCRLVDFDLRKNGVVGPEPVIKWVVDYFTPPRTSSQSGNNVTDALRGATPVSCTDKMPLILQHSGHSRTIVGYEITKSGAVNLLCFDPSKKPERAMRDAGLAASSLPGSSGGSKPSRGIQHLLHPLSFNGKRRASSSSTIPDGSSPKRRRADENKPEDPEIEIIGVNMASAQRSSARNEDALDWKAVLDFSRLNLTQLGRNDQYQILYFPLSAPLTDKERLAKKVVCSTKIC